MFVASKYRYHVPRRKFGQLKLEAVSWNCADAMGVATIRWSVESGVDVWLLQLVYPGQVDTTP